MGEFDLSLINEFRNRPSFYDRNSSRFKDKIYNAHQWQEISNKLGFDVSIIKDRMLQLRNRYNLEKRRLEQLREENPDRTPESPWPLYEHLHFLSDHIRARRSYKKMLPLNYHPSQTSSGSLEQYHHSDRNTIQAAQTTFPSSLLRVKMEENESEGQDSEEGTTESQSNDLDGNTFEPSTILSITQNLHSPNEQNSNALDEPAHNIIKSSSQPSITIRRLETLRSEPIINNIPNKKRAFHHQSRDLNASYNTNMIMPPTKQPRLVAREQTYIAFSNFVSSSLMDLSQNAALELVKNFTTDIVAALIEKSNENAAEEFSQTVE